MNDQVSRIYKLENALDWAADDILLILDAVKKGGCLDDRDGLTSDLEELYLFIEELLKK